MENDAGILIVDDSAIVRQTVKTVLLEMGYTNILAASNGKEALEKMQESKLPDNGSSIKVIFLDRNMPEMDGLSFLKILRNELCNNSTAVIMLTAFSDNESIITCVEAGATSYAIKPVTNQDIEEKMKFAVKWLAKQEN